MTNRQTSLFLWCTTAGLVLAAVAVASTGWLWPYDVSTPTNRAGTPPDHAEARRTLPPLATFEKVSDMDLRRPLDDQPDPAVAAPTVTPPPVLPVRLAGTVIEPGHSVAMFITHGGDIQLRGVGETIGDVKVLGITPDGVSVQHEGRTVRLSLEQGDPR